MQIGVLDDVARPRGQDAVEAGARQVRRRHVADTQRVAVGIGGPEDVPPSAAADDLREHVQVTAATSHPGSMRAAAVRMSSAAARARSNATWTTETTRLIYPDDGRFAEGRSTR